MSAEEGAKCDSPSEACHTYAVRCRSCQRSFAARRSDALTCSARCRRARSRLRASGSRSAILAAEWGITRGDLWRTPPALLELLGKEHRLVVDLAALEDDAVCPRWVGPDQDALAIPWAPLIAQAAAELGPDPAERPPAGWVNPPYSQRAGGSLAWCRQAHAAALEGATVWMLIATGPGSRAACLARDHAEAIRWTARRLACLHPDTGEPNSGNNMDQALIRWGPRGGPAQETHFTPPRGALAGGRGAPVDWTPRYRGGDGTT